MKLLFSLVIASTLIGCGSSSDDPGPPEGPATLDDGSDEPGAGFGTGTGGDTDPETDLETDLETDPETDPEADPETDTGTGSDSVAGGEVDERIVALETASTLDTGVYRTLIARASSVESTGRYTARNYRDAIAVAAEATRARLTFARGELLALLEQQILDNDTPLAILNTTEGPYGRVHRCPDGGRLLADKGTATDAGANGLAGEYRFEDCEIGDVYIDGDYTASREGADPAVVAASVAFTQLRIDGVDGIITTFPGASLTQEVRIEDDDAGEQVQVTETTERGSFTVGVPGTGTVDVDVQVTTSEGVVTDLPLEPLRPLPADTRSVRIDTNRVSVYDDIDVRQSSGTLDDLARGPESDRFDRGGMAFTMQPAANRLELRMDNGDEGTFDVLVREQDGSVVSFVESWNEDGDPMFGSDQRLMILQGGR